MRTKKLWLYLALIIMLLALAGYFIPLRSKEYRVNCTNSIAIKTRFTIFEKESYDNSPVEYFSPGNELKDCTGIPGRIGLYLY